VEAVATREGRMLGASAVEVSAAARAVAAALRHPLLERARAAATRGECRRETPVTLMETDGTLVEGVVDLAFREEGAWTVVDFKTDRDLGLELPVYRRQVALYARAVASAMGEMAHGVLLRV
jgi:ATP-dependent exoDNAse (exonuclease V) beta subunit